MRSGTARRGDIMKVGDQRIHVHRVGSRGPIVLLLHGCGSLGEEILHPFLPDMNVMTLLAPDRPGYGYSDPLPAGDRGPAGQAEILARLLDRLGVEACLLVAHSLAGGTALALAGLLEKRCAGLLLLGGFVRPTPHAAMPVLRLITAPRLGPILQRTVVGWLADPVGRNRLQAIHAPNPVPGYLAHFPFRHAAKPSAMKTVAAELRGFNSDVAALGASRSLRHLPVAALHGCADTIADPAWHLPWLRRVAPQAKVRELPGVGHAPHHARPALARQALRELAGLC